MPFQSRLPGLPLDNWFWWVCENYLYRLPEPAPRVRERPMEVLCVGMSRSGSESLSKALEILGYPTYHGWDLLLEHPTRMPGWKKLVEKKYFGTPDGELTAADFDALLGHRVAVADMASYFFAPELIDAYPDAKVIFNYRKDMSRWVPSMDKTIMPVAESLLFYVTSWFEARTFWAYHFTYRWFLAFAYRSPYGDFGVGVRKCGPWVYRDHRNMIKGQVLPHRLLEWTYEDGWEPLCKFLGKEIPNEPFPHANASGADFESKGNQVINITMRKVVRNLAIVTVAFGLLLGYSWREYHA
ncbi:hypothetical protein F4779DRAFT_608898 [Xylariaceae sp. FL0662B]|nr:hypothetical protein F4779DRAFT_608898 [Xylariaceae sp. FL0662B]